MTTTSRALSANIVFTASLASPASVSRIISPQSSSIGKTQDLRTERLPTRTRGYLLHWLSPPQETRLSFERVLTILPRDRSTSRFLFAPKTVPSLSRDRNR